MQPTGEADVAVVPVTVSVDPSFVTNVRLWWWVSVMREAVREQGLLVDGGPLYLPPDFAVNLKLLYKIVCVKKKKKDITSSNLMLQR